MSMIYTETAGNGKKYDHSGRFRLIIEVFGTSDDGVTKILRRMKNGTVIAYDSLVKATTEQAEFSRLADFVAESGILACYGFTCVIDTRDGCIHSTIPIMPNMPDAEF